MNIDSARAGVPDSFGTCGNWLCIVLVAMLALAPGPTWAQGESEASEGNLDQRYQQLFQQLFDEPLNLDVMFEFARTAAKLGRTEAAISTLERMLLINPNLPRVRLELGALYFRLGSYQAARGYFEQVEDSTGLPPQVRDRVQAYLGRIESRERRHALNYGTFFGVRYQTNANSAPDNEQVRVFGLDFILDEDGQQQEDANLFASATLRHSYDLQTGVNESWDSTLLGYSSRQQDLSELDLDVLETTTGPTFAVWPAHLDRATVRPYGKLSHVRLGRNELYTGYGGGADATWLLGPRAALNGGYEVLYKDFEDSENQANASDSTGAEHQISLTGRYAADQSITMIAGVGVRLREADEEFESFNESYLRVGADYRYTDPVLGSGLPWRVGVRVRGAVTDFDAPDPIVDPNVNRHDRQLRFTLTQTVRLTRFAAINLQAQYTDNDSNLPNFEYDNLAVLGGVALNF